MHRCTATATAATLILALAAGTADARHRNGGDGSYARPYAAQPRANSEVGPAAAAQAARDATGGRVLGVRAASRYGRQVYLVKVLLDGGRMRVLVVDAQTARVMR